MQSHSSGLKDEHLVAVTDRSCRDGLRLARDVLVDRVADYQSELNEPNAPATDDSGDLGRHL